MVPCVSQAFYDQQRNIVLYEVFLCKHGLDASRVLQCLLQALCKRPSQLMSSQLL